MAAQLLVVPQFRRSVYSGGQLDTDLLAVLFAAPTVMICEIYCSGFRGEDRFWR